MLGGEGCDHGVGVRRGSSVVVESGCGMEAAVKTLVALLVAGSAPLRLD
jgi:hypothetical protein